MRLPWWHSVVVAHEVCLLQNQRFLRAVPEEIDRQPRQTALSTSAASLRRIDDANLVFIKIPKTGSSTVGGAARRIAAQHGLHGYDDATRITEEPGLWANHCPAREVSKWMEALRLPSFVFTIVREPATRCLSEFYHFQVRQGTADTVDNKLAYLNSCRNFQFEYMRRVEGPQSVDEVLASYHFVGTLEDVEGSMVALAEKLQVDLTDVLYITAKNSSQRSDGHSLGGTKHPHLSQEAAAVQDFVNNEFRQNNHLDYELYDTVRSRLAEQLEGLHEKVTRYHEMLHEVTSLCTQPGLETDTIQEWIDEQFQGDCYWGDNGCGVACINDYASLQSR